MLLILPMVLAACGGNGSGLPGGAGTGRKSLRATPITAQVALPAGAQGERVNGLRVWTSGSAASPDASGKAGVTVFNDGPQYTEARDPQGRLVLAGFLGANGKTLDAASTAEMLAYFATGAPMATGEARRKVFDGLRSITGFAEVVAEVENDLKTDGYLTPNDEAMIAKLDAMVTAIGGIPGAGARARSLPTRGAIVSPSTQVSGISVDTTVDGQVALQNVYLRRAMAWLDKVSYNVKIGERTTVVPADEPETPVKPIEIDSPKRYAGFIGTIADLLQGNIAYSPTNAGPFPIPAIDPKIEGCVGTNYHLTIVGPGAIEGDRGSLKPARRAEADKLIFKAAFLDYLLPFFVTVVMPIDGELFDDFAKHAGASVVLQDLATTIFATAPNVADLMWKGEYYQAAIALRDAGLLSNTLLPAITQMFLNWAEDSSSDAVANMTERYAKDAKAMLGTIGSIDKWLSILETGVVASDLVNSKTWDLVRIESTGGKVTITAEKQKLPATESTSLTAVIQDKNPDAVYKYQWSVSAGFRLNDKFGKTTDDTADGVLTSSQDTVGIISKENKDGTATVRCKVTRIDGAVDLPVDDSTGSVTFEAKDPAEELPTGLVVGYHIREAKAGGVKVYRAEVEVVARVAIKPGRHQYVLTSDKAPGITGGKPIDLTWTTDLPPTPSSVQIIIGGSAPNTYIVPIKTGFGHSSSHILTYEEALADIQPELAELHAAYGGLKLTVTTTPLP